MAKNSKKRAPPTFPNKKITDFVSKKKKKKTPKVLYAEDGGTFYPCTHCCRAFSNKKDLEKHDVECAEGRGTPMPFARGSASSETSEELNNNEKGKNPRRKAAAIAEENNRKLARIEEANNNLQIRNAVQSTKVITTGSAGQNINTLSESTRLKVVERLNQLLEGYAIRIVAEPRCPIVVQTIREGLPFLEITSKNMNANCVELKIAKTDRAKLEPNLNLPDIAQILTSTFPTEKPPIVLDTASDSEEEFDPDVDDLDFKAAPKIAKSVHSIDESEISEIVIDDTTLEGTIVLEDLDIHICKRCGSVYHTLDDLVNHDKYEHRKMKKRYPLSELEKFNLVFRSGDRSTCPICFKILRSRTAWPRHLNTHSEVSKFSCKVCYKKFTRDDHRKLHEKRHVVPPKSKDRK